MSIFIYLDYRKWIKDWLKKSPKGGRGQLSKMAVHLNSNSTLLSQVLKGTREFSTEQAHLLADFFSFNFLETKYWMLLLNLERAGTKALKDFYRNQIEEIREQSLKVQNRVSTDRELTDAEKAMLVSSWKPAAIFIFCSRDGGVSLEEVSASLKLPPSKVKVIVDRLVEIGLLRREGTQILNGYTRLHIPKGSPYISRHYTNWRLKAIENSEDISEEELIYTSLAGVSPNDIPVLKEKILQLISEYSKVVTASPAEQLVCLNIDYFKVSQNNK
jgi:uncharacterized protein (TIGR02147 family)